VQITDWAWVVLGVFFLLQGVAATYMIRSIMRLRRTQHRIANYVQVIGGQLEQRGLVTLSDADGKGLRGDAG
jgi:hypothetical protein